MAKRGRPFSQNPKNTRVVVQMTAEEHDQLEKMSEQYGITMSDIVRDSLMLYELAKKIVN